MAPFAPKVTSSVRAWWRLVASQALTSPIRMGAEIYLWDVNPNSFHAVERLRHVGDVLFDGEVAHE
jgi:hypothetical protein